MESEVSSNILNSREDSSQKTFNLEKLSSVEAKDVELIEAADGRATLGPVTPDPCRENGEVVIDFKSPLTWASSPAGIVFSHSCRTEKVSGADDSPRTPREDVFDPFAPGRDELMLAPICKKYLDESRSNIARRLNFESFVESTRLNEVGDGSPHEEILLESVYETLLEAIVSKQAEEEVVDEPSSVVSLSDGCSTPTSFPLSDGIANTCPDAPVKPARSKTLKIDQEICRKLEF